MIDKDKIAKLTPLPRDLVLILRTEARNQRTPPIDYVIAEDGGRMVHQPEPDIAMAELLEEAATALVEKDKEIAALREALEGLINQYASRTFTGVIVSSSEQYPWIAKAMKALARNAGGNDAT